LELLTVREIENKIILIKIRSFRTLFTEKIWYPLSNRRILILSFKHISLLMELLHRIIKTMSIMSLKILLTWFCLIP